MRSKNEEYFMQAALDKAAEGVEKGQTPFGACIVKDGKIIAVEHNSVWADTDITAHAEVNTIRVACEKLGSIDLSGCALYSTCEPCPMCFSAIHWAKIDKIVFGASIEDAQDAGFSELTVSNRKLKELGDIPIEITGDFMLAEAIKLFETWLARKDRRTY